jgi:Flp pilus assembly protein TadB
VNDLAAVLAAAAGWMLGGGPLPAGPPPLHVPVRRVVLGLGAAAATGVIALAGGTDPMIAASLATMAALVPGALAERSRRAAAERLAGRWPDFVAAIRSELAGGASVPEATIAAGHRLGDRFAALAGDLEASLGAGEDLAEAFEGIRRAWADPLADRVLVTLAASAAAGGDRVGAILSALGASIADEVRLRRAHDAALTQQRLTAGVALVAPWALLVLTTSTNPQAADALARPGGRMVVAAGLAATAAGYVLARRAARLAQPGRVFR